MSPSTEVIDLLQPRPLPQAALLCSAGCNHHTHPGKGWATARQLSPAPQQPKTSHQLGFAAKAPQALVWGQQLSKPAASSRLAPSSTSSQPSRAVRAGIWDGKCNRGSEGTAQVLGLGSNSCRIFQQGHLPSSSSRSHNPCPAVGTALSCSSTLGTPQAPRREGRRGASQVLRLNPQLFKRWIFLGDLRAP